MVLRDSAIVNGFTSLAVNKLDVLSGLDEIPVATAYRIDGKLDPEFPMTLGELARVEPVYEVLPGWDEALTGDPRVRRAARATRGATSSASRRCSRCPWT